MLLYNLMVLPFSFWDLFIPASLIAIASGIGIYRDYIKAKKNQDDDTTSFYH